MKLRFTPKAIENIVAIADYVHAHSPAGAKRVRADIYGGLQNLILFPNVGRRQETPGVRKFITRKFSYLVYYTVDNAADEIVVLSVQHPAQEREHSDA